MTAATALDEPRRWPCSNCQWNNVGNGPCGGCGPAAARAPYDPAPGIEYPFAISDIARAAAKLLGDGWSVESGYWGVTGRLTTPAGDLVTVGVDDEGDLYVSGPPALEPNYLRDATATDGVDALAELVAQTSRELTARDPEPLVYAYDQANAREVRAAEVQPGDLVVGDATSSTQTRTYFEDAYPAAPTTHDPAHCTECAHVEGPGVRLSTPDTPGNPWGECDPWSVESLALIIPAALRTDAHR